MTDRFHEIQLALFSVIDKDPNWGDEPRYPGYADTPSNYWASDSVIHVYNKGVLVYSYGANSNGQ